ncbi:MAG: SDR family NAD(P)-dependent oxidoreductase [Actinomycetota bacterium]|nr:SDR family NAD(P)-dependent oxidoreductase [Actinomycetota bacterium]
MPEDRWNLDLFYDPDPDAPGRMYTRSGGFLTDSLYDFDPEFFGISAREASIMDPQQRLVLEVAWEALDDAGLAGRVGGRDVGVYVGAFMNDNQVRRHIPAARTALSNHTPTSSGSTMLSNRLSYVLDLRGPSLTIDTACSSSLVAIHEATQAVAHGVCEIAIAGGVNVMLHPETTISMCKGRFLATDGRCKSFDAAADGYARGEGAGMIVVKPLDEALRDGDRIYAVIRGSGVNQDGHTTGITVPNPDAQAALASRVYTEAEIDPSQIGYVEAHGTGTAIGDPLEMAALGRAVGNVDGRTEPLVVGSVKAAIGHLEAAAGVAGVIKAALVVYHGTIAPQAWLQTLNPAIPFGQLNLRVPTEVEEFPDSYAQPLAAVNGFGYGGTNAHVVLAPGPGSVPAPQPRHSGVRIFPISGATEAAARAIAAATATGLDAGDVDVDAVRDAAWARRAHHGFRAALMYGGADDLAAKLGEFARDESKKVGRVIAPAGTRPVFVFSGMGPQWWRMGRDLLHAGGIFARTARTIDAYFTEMSGWSIIDELLRDEDESKLTRTEVAQPANFLLQVSLVAELEALSVRPSAVVGHSVGEVAAAYVSGALSMRDAVAVSYHRSRLQATTAGTGGMMAVGIGEAALEEWLSGYERVSVAAINGPSSVTLAGHTGALETLRGRLVDEGIFARMLRVEVPYHSPLMDPILAELEQVLGDLQPAAPTLALYSTVTGRRVADASWDAGYWRDNVREPVSFAATMTGLIDEGHRVFVEVGPHPVLGGNIRELLIRVGEPGACISTLERKEDDERSLLRAIGDLYVAGCVEAGEVPGAGAGPATHVDLPAYPWQRTRLWTEEDEAVRLRLGTSGTRPLLGERTDARAAEWEVELSVNRLPWLHDHVIDGHVVLPGAAYLDAALSAAAERGGRENLALESVRFAAPLIVEDHDVPVLRLAVDESTSRFTLRSRTAVGKDWTVNVTGRLVDGHVEPPALCIERDADAAHVSGEDLYQQLAEAGLHYGPAFQRIVEAWVGADTVVATVDATFASDRGHLTCPTVTDAALQCVAALTGDADGPFVPANVGVVRRFGALPATVTVVAQRRSGAGLHADVLICGSDDEVLLELGDIEFARINPPVPAIAELDRLFYEMEWEWRDRDDRQVPAGGAANDLTIVVDLGSQLNLRARALATSSGRGHLVPLRPSGEAQATARISEIVRGALADPAVGRVLVVVVAGGWETTREAPVGLHAIGGLAAVARGIDDALIKLGPAARTPPIRGVIVTDHALRLPGDRHEPNLAHAALVGARRALLNEQPVVRWRLVDLESDVTDAELRAELWIGGREDLDADEVCLRQDARMVPRLRRTLAGRLARFAEPVPVASAEDSYALESRASAGAPDLALRSCERVAPGPGEVELRIEAVALHDEDYEKAAGMRSTEDLAGTYFQSAAGMEGAGVVTRVGPGVANLSPGDRVSVIARGVFRRYLTISADEGFLAPTARGATPAYCTSLMPFITAHYGLCFATRVSAGETVLVHGADGGACLAAVQVARCAGARVIASASTAERRSGALAAGAHEVVDSRSLNFADDVLRMTHGRGADVVLNSLSGEVARQNLRVAAEFGRIIEIGKVDIRADGVMSLRPFDRNLSFTAVDIDRMLECRPELFRRIAGEVCDRLESGAYAPLPATSYPLTELDDAFDAVAKSRHAGQVLVTMEPTAGALPMRPGFVVRSDATYLVTGGFGAFGLATARWLAARGARHLVLVGRRGASTPAARAQVEAFAAAGVEVVQGIADVANLDEVQALVERTVDTMPPLRGVFHAAGVVDDAPLAELTADSLRRVLEPKTRGALNLDAVLDRVEHDLDAFVLYSSVSAVVGPVPQIAYAGANAVLDGLAAVRRARGKPALSVNWGALSGGGMAEASDEVERYLALLGVLPIALARATAMLEECLGLGDDVVTVAVSDINWGKYAAACPASAASTRFSEHVAAASSEGSDAAALRQELLRMSEEQRSEVLAYVLAEQLAAVLGVGADAVDLHTALPDLGVDSLMAVELAAGIFVTLGVEISALEFSRGSGLMSIAARVSAQIVDGAGTPQRAIAVKEVA